MLEWRWRRFEEEWKLTKQRGWGNDRLGNITERRQNSVVNMQMVHSNNKKLLCLEQKELGGWGEEWGRVGKKPTPGGLHRPGAGGVPSSVEGQGRSFKTEIRQEGVRC